VKKTLVYFLIALLLFALTGCIGLSKKHGFGELIILGDNLTREADPDQGETEPQPVAKEATVTIGGETKKLGEKFVLRTGTHTAKIKDGKFAVTITVKIEKINKTVTLKPKAVLKKLQFNAWKFIFDPQRYKVVVENEVHLVGGFGEENNDATWWKPHYLGYPLIKQLDGTWSAIFNLPEGTEFKFIYDSTDWDGHDLGAPDGNYIIGVHDEVVIPVQAWQFTFDPSKVSGLEAALGEDEIATVSIAGAFGEKQWAEGIPYNKLVKQADETWVGYFEVEKGTKFKFVVNGDIWVGTAGIGGMGDDYELDEIPGVATQEF